MLTYVFFSLDGKTLVQHELNHNHTADVGKLSRQVISNACKRKAVDDICERPSKIINSEVAISQYKEHLTVNDVNLIRHSINRNRKSVMTNVPKSIKDVHSALEFIHPKTDRNEEFLLVNDRENNIIIFGCKTYILCLSESKTFYMDGTFKYAPKFFYQLFSIHCLRNGHYIPLMFCILPNKEVRTYTLALRHIVTFSQSLNIDLSPDEIIIDFEVAIHKAVNIVWPTSKIFGCRFHLTQSWYRKINSLGLSTTYKSDSEKAKWLHHLFGLPYLSPDKVSECFVEDFMASLPEENSFSKLSDYLVDTYISEEARFPPAMWASNTSDLSLTTNPCESFHAHFSNYFFSSTSKYQHFC